MISRRLVRIKVLQQIYSQYQFGELNTQLAIEAFKEQLIQSHDIYTLMLKFPQAWIEYLLSDIELEKQKYYPDKEKIRQYSTLAKCKKAEEIEQYAVAVQSSKKAEDWSFLGEQFEKITIELLAQEFVKDYIIFDEPNEEQQLAFIELLYEHLFNGSELFYSVLEEKFASWPDDEYSIHREIAKITTQKHKFAAPRVSFAADEIVFGIELCKNVISHFESLNEEINKITINWDATRIAVIDMICIKMALCEYLYCETIPLKVTINEYLEIIKNYSTPNSSKFVNGILDKIRVHWLKEGRILKTGRGLRTN